MKRAEIEKLLPEIYQRTLLPGTPQYALLEVMEAMHGPSESALRDLAETFDPRRTSDDFVAFLARWVDLDRLFVGATLPEAMTPGLGRLRELIVESAELAKWRGTARGLIRFLQVATGISGFEIDEEVTDETGHLRPFHIRLRVPEEATRHRALIARIIESEKPAYVTYELAPASKS
jgi:phage tail-like protein